MKATVLVRPKQGILDPQGQAVESSLRQLGFSVGGEMMLQAAASNSGLRAVISEGAGARSIREDLLRGPRGWFALPEAAFQSAALAVMSGTPPPPALDPVRCPPGSLRTPQ